MTLKPDANNNVSELQLGGKHVSAYSSPVALRTLQLQRDSSDSTDTVISDSTEISVDDSSETPAHESADAPADDSSDTPVPDSTQDSSDAPARGLDSKPPETVYRLRPRRLPSWSGNSSILRNRRRSKQSSNETLTSQPNIIEKDNASARSPKVSGVKRLSPYRRKDANARERQRMKHINGAFEALRRALPHPGSSLTKRATLQRAVAYIRALDRLLQDPPDSALNRLLQDPPNSALDRLLQDPTKTAHNRLLQDPPDPGVDRLLRNLLDTTTSCPSQDQSGFTFERVLQVPHSAASGTNHAVTLNEDRRNSEDSTLQNVPSTQANDYYGTCCFEEEAFEDPLPSLEDPQWAHASVQISNIGITA